MLRAWFADSWQSFFRGGSLVSTRAAQDRAARIEPITAEDTRPLRHAILRTGRPLAETVFEGDHWPGTRHYGAFIDGRLIAVATLIPEATPAFSSAGAWRIRGMAVDESFRGRGLGAALVRACLDHAKSQRGRLCWCNARVGARDFYLRCAFALQGEEFDVPGLGPHNLMFIKLEPDKTSD